MEYQKLETKHGTVIIMDADELEGLIDIYKSVFKTHNIFQKERDEIIDYLKESHSKHSEFGGGYIVAKLGDKRVGGILVRKQSEDFEGKHVIWKYNHVGVSPEFSRAGIGVALVNAADQKIKQLITDGKFQTAKIELGVSENEKDAIEFFKKCGFEIEGKLKSHYRYGELVYLLGKEISL